MSYKAKLGVNTIWDKARWMCDLGISEEDAKSYMPQSNKFINVTCPLCGRVKKIKISNIYNYKSIGCICRDGYSYGHKYTYSVLEQLNISFEQNVTPEWCRFFNIYKNRESHGQYDFVIEDLKLILEVDGGFHRANNYKNNQKLEENIYLDNTKDKLALENGYKIIRIFYDDKKKNIKTYLIKELNEIFDFDNINWTLCEDFATKNIIKEVCEYWCNKKDEETTRSVARVFKTNKTVITSYLKEGSKLGWCVYNPEEEKSKSDNKLGKNGKKVQVFKDGEELGIFESTNEVERISKSMFGVEMRSRSIARVCRGERNHHKGYTFKYVEE